MTGDGNDNWYAEHLRSLPPPPPGGLTFRRVEVASGAGPGRTQTGHLWFTDRDLHLSRHGMGGLGRPKPYLDVAREQVDAVAFDRPFGLRITYRIIHLDGRIDHRWFRASATILLDELGARGWPLRHLPSYITG